MKRNKTLFRILALALVLLIGLTLAPSIPARAEDSSITVHFRLIGDTAHGPDKDGVVTGHHENYFDWVAMTEVTLTTANPTVWDAFQAALADTGITYSNRGNYIEWIQKDGVKLSEFTNGSNSGWKYIMKGTDGKAYYPNVGLAEKTVQDGDYIVWHYTDNYQTEDAQWLAAFDTGDYATAINASTYTISVEIPPKDENNYVVLTAAPGYTVSPGAEIKLYAIGNNAPGALKIEMNGTGANYFNVSATAANLSELGDTATFTVSPKPGLPDNGNDYTVTIQISAADDNPNKNFIPNSSVSIKFRIEEPASSSPSRGDVDGDGNITNIDAVLILRKVAGFTDANFNAEAADIDGDGAVTNNDAVQILRKVAGLSSALDP